MIFEVSAPFWRFNGLLFPLTGIKDQKPINMIQKTYFKTKDYCKVKFSFTDEAINAEKVEILGLNSDWKNAIAMSKKKDGSFTADVSLPKNSQHEFKYLVNATEWINDPAADAQHSNVYGGSNSVITL